MTSTKKINSKRKGSNGEREIAKILREHGYEARRGQQYSGANGDADVVGVPGVHIEVKRGQQLNIEKAMQQAEADKRPGEMPVVFHRKNGEEWKATMRLDDWLEMLDCKSILEGRRLNNEKPEC